MTLGSMFLSEVKQPTAEQLGDYFMRSLDAAVNPCLSTFQAAADAAPTAQMRENTLKCATRNGVTLTTTASAGVSGPKTGGRL